MMVKEKFGDLITTQGHGNKKFLCPCPGTVEPVCIYATAENRCTQEGTGPQHPHVHIICTQTTRTHSRHAVTRTYKRARVHTYTQPPTQRTGVHPSGIPSPLPAAPSAVQGAHRWTSSTPGSLCLHPQHPSEFCSGINLTFIISGSALLPCLL